MIVAASSIQSLSKKVVANFMKRTYRFVNLVRKIDCKGNVFIIIHYKYHINNQRPQIIKSESFHEKLKYFLFLAQIAPKRAQKWGTT